MHGRKDGDSAAPPLDGGGRRGGRTQRERERFSRLCARARSGSALLFRRRDTERGDTHKHSATPPPMVRDHTSRPASPSPPTHTQPRARVGRLRPHTRAGFSRRAETRIGQAFFFLPLLYSPRPFHHPTGSPRPGHARGRALLQAGAGRRRRHGCVVGRGAAEGAAGSRQHTSTRIGNRERASRGRFHRSPFSRPTLSSRPHRQNHFCEAPPDGRV